MPRIAIITDTDSSLPDDIARRNHIYQIPITVQFGEESFTTGANLDDKELFEMIDRRKKLPTTAAPSPDAFFRAFHKAFDEGYDEIICICVSSKISATYQAALSAAEMLPGKDITIVDSLNLCMAQGFIVLAAAEAAALGLSKDEIIKKIVNIQPRIHVYAALPTLKYLAMGGRMSKLSAGVADTLDIKPLLSSREGKLELLEKVRTMRKAEDRLLELARACIDEKQIESIALIHVNNLPGAKALFDKLKTALQIEVDPIYAEFTPGLSVHAGSGVIGFVLVIK